MSCDLEEPRYYRMSIRVTPTERRTLKGRANRAGLEFSAYARELLLKTKPPRAARTPSIGAVLMAQTLATLGGVATSLDRLAGGRAEFGVHRMLHVDRELLRALAQLRACCVEILRALGRKACRA